jgi:hypothetical protein
MPFNSKQNYGEIMSNEDHLIAVAIHNARKCCDYYCLGWKEYLAALETEIDLIFNEDK